MQFIFVEGTICKSDPVKVTTQNGSSMARFSIAVRSGYGSYSHCDYFNCIAFGKIADVILDKFRKKSLIQVVGEMTNRPYKKDAKGFDIPNWQVNVKEVHFPPKNAGKTADNAEYPEEQAVSYSDNSNSAVSDDDFTIIDDNTDLPF